jgi:hypothetical protein
MLSSEYLGSHLPDCPTAPRRRPRRDNRNGEYDSHLCIWEDWMIVAAGNGIDTTPSFERKEVRA